MDQGIPHLAKGDDLAAKPGSGAQLLPPLPQRSAAAFSALAVLGAGLAFSYLCFVDFGKQATAIDVTAGQRQQSPKLIVLKAEDYPGSVRQIDRELAIQAPYTLDSMNMPPVEKQRLKSALEKDKVKVGAITLWDNVAEDGDAVEVAGAGFTQKLTIMHKPTAYFVPFQQGGTVRITGLVDAGGGITLGVQTALGNQFLPPLIPGEILELQIP
jgi:hypothetical protein